MHRIRPQSYKIIAKKQALLYRLTLKNEKNFKTRGERGFLLLLKKELKYQNIIFYLILIYLTYFQLFIKHAYVIFVMKDYIIWTENEKRRKMVFRGIMSRNWLAELRKCATDGTFHPYRRVKREGWKAGWRGRMIIFSELYWRIYKISST